LSVRRIYQDVFVGRRRERERPDAVELTCRWFASSRLGRRAGLCVFESDLLNVNFLGSDRQRLKCCCSVGDLILSTVFVEHCMLERDKSGSGQPPTWKARGPRSSYDLGWCSEEGLRPCKLCCVRFGSLDVRRFRKKVGNLVCSNFVCCTY
jgi:hypothetical protein